MGTRTMTGASGGYVDKPRWMMTIAMARRRGKEGRDKRNSMQRQEEDVEDDARKCKKLMTILPMGPKPPLSLGKLMQRQLYYTKEDGITAIEQKRDGIGSGHQVRMSWPHQWDKAHTTGR